MTKREVIVDWLRWFKESTSKTIEMLIEDVEEENETDIMHYLEENILEDFGRLERGLKRDTEKLEIKKIWEEDKNED
jgi:hypothetical protein